MLDSLVRIVQKSRAFNITSRHQTLCKALRRNHLVSTLFEAIAKKKEFVTVWVPGLVVRTWKHGCGQGHTGQRTRETTERRCDMKMVVHFLKDSSWSSAVHQAQSDAPLQVRHRTCGCRSSRHVHDLRFWRRVWHGRVVPSSSEASAMAQPAGSSGAGSGSIIFAKRSSRAWRAAASVTASRKSSSLWARKRRQPVVHAWFLSQRSFTARAAHSAEEWRRHALFNDQAVEGATKDGTGKSGARLSLDAAFEAAEDCHVRKAASTTCFVAGGRRARREGEWPAWLSGWPRWRGRWLARSQRRIHDCPSLLGFSIARRQEWPRAAGSWPSLPKRRGLR